MVIPRSRLILLRLKQMNVKGEIKIARERTRVGPFRNDQFVTSLFSVCVCTALSFRRYGRTSRVAATLSAFNVHSTLKRIP